MKSIITVLTIAFLLGSCGRNNVDLIIHNASIYTVNEDFEIASAIAIKDGKFVAVGEEDILERYTANATLDVKGVPIYPGFIDAHCHFYALGMGLDQADLRGAKSVDEIITRLQKLASSSQGDILLGRGWDQNLWEKKEFPTKEALDAAFPDKMVVLERVDGHATYVNSKVLNAAGITADTAIAGGEVILVNGEPSGVLIDNASTLAYNVLPKSPRSKEIRALKKAEEIAFSYGLTTVDDAGLNQVELSLIDSLHQTKDLKIRIYGMISNTPENLAYYLEKGIYQSDRLTIRSVKVYADGALGSRGAALLEPYADDKSNKGLFITPADQIQSLAIKLADKGFQMNTHAIGDAANQVVLQAYANALEDKKDPRWRVEHAQVVTRKDIELFGSKVIPSVQPTHATSDMEWADERLGDKRVKTAYTYKDLLDWSGKLALGTDFPVEEVDPLNTFYAAVARKNKIGDPSGGYQMKNALSRSEALKGMTIWAAYANFEEDQKGSIEVGKVADFVLMSKDIMAISETKILDSQVLATFLEGEMVFQMKK